jgi:homospermidine synthase
MTKTTFDGRILVIGLGAVSRCTLPLLLDHLDCPPDRYTVIDFADVAEDAKWVQAQGMSFVPDRVTADDYAEVLGRYVGNGDIIVDLAWNIDTIEVLEWCRATGVRYVNASLEVWDPYGEWEGAPPRDRTLYARHMQLRDAIERWGSNDGPTAVLDHGANPGLVSHFTKQALLDIAEASVSEGVVDGGQRELIVDARDRRAWNELAMALDVKVIHISERDTQISSDPKREGEFVNTWSVEGFYEEGIAPAEMGWGTHEQTLPPGADVHRRGPRNQIALAHPGCRTWVRSWVPCGEIVGMVIRHGEAFSISDRLTVWSGDEAVYRPTVHYAYCPCDAAIASLHELHMRRDELQVDQRIMGDDIVSGRDELGCLLMGHPLTSWWIGSLLDIHETRELVPQQNATTLQVAASVLAAVLWMIENPSEGVRLPDDLPHEFVLEKAKPYLGPFVSERSSWDPLSSWKDPFEGFGVPKPSENARWQFPTFLVQAPW